MLHVWLKPLADNSLAPVSGFDRALIEKLPRGGKVLAKLSQPRSLRHHNKLFGILTKAFDQQERYDSFDRFRAYVAVKAGFKKAWEYPSGSITEDLLLGLSALAPHVFAEPMESGIGVRLLAPKSLSFDAMDQTEFASFYERAMDVLLRDFGFDISELEKDPT